MLLQIILAVIAATLIIVASYRYLNWKAMLSLGGLFLVAATVALFLNYQNDSITWSVPVGGGLFRQGDSVSILGEYWWLALLILLTGIVLMIAGVIKRIRMPSPAPVSKASEDPATEREKIEKALKSEIAEVQGNLGNPSEKGVQDAQDSGGAIPRRHATEPEGFEVDARQQYETLGKSFVLNTATRLKDELGEALRTLSDIKTKLTKDYYAKKASADYRENAEEYPEEEVERRRKAVDDAGRSETQFRNRLELPSGDDPEWDKPTSGKQLIIFGVLFALIEFGVSYYLLKDQIGDRAFVNALYAVVVIFVLSVASAWLFRFMRLPHKALIRALASVVYIACFGLLILSFGLLLEFRAVETQVAGGEFFSALNTMLTGYGSVLTDLGNLTLFLINMLAFGLFYWKFLLWHERFRGYRRVGERLRQAKGEWLSMFNKNNACIKNALDHANNEASGARKAASQAVRKIQEKKDVLENIQAILAPAFVKKLHSAYRNGIRDYRASNTEHRNVTVNPAPAYFRQDSSLCAADEHFIDNHGVDEFLASQQQSISQAEDTRQEIENTVTDWHNQSAQLNEKWTKEFKRKIDGAGI